MLSATTVEDALTEYRRLATLPRVNSAILHHWPNGGPSPADDDDKFWQEMINIGFPISVHVGLGARTSDQAKLPRGHFNNVTAIGTLRGGTYTQWSIAQLILSGVFDRFPDLTLYFAESGAAWVAAWMENADNSYLRHREWTGYDFPLLPSEYVRRHCLFGFQDERYGVVHRSEIGVEKLLWANDFPHSARIGLSQGNSSIASWTECRKRMSGHPSHAPRQRGALLHTRGRRVTSAGFASHECPDGETIEEQILQQARSAIPRFVGKGC